MKKFFVCLLLLFLSCITYAQDNVVFNENQGYRIIAKHNGKAVDVGCDDTYNPSQPNSKRDNLGVFNWHGGDNQIFFIQKLPDGYYRIVAKHNGKVWDVGCSDTYNPAEPNSQRDNLCVFKWHGGDNQHFKLERLSDGSYRIIAKHNGKVADVGCDDTYNAAQPNSKRDNLCVFNWHGKDNQHFYIQPVGPRNTVVSNNPVAPANTVASNNPVAPNFPMFAENRGYRIIAKHNRKVVDVGCDDVYNPAQPNSQRDNLGVFNWHGGANQIFFIQKLSDGYYRIVAKHNGKVWDVGCDDAYNAAQPNSKRDNLCVFNWHGNDNQHFKFERLSDGSYRIIAKHNGKVADVGCDDTYNAAQPNSKRDNLCVFNWHGNDNQHFYIEAVSP